MPHTTQAVEFLKRWHGDKYFPALTAIPPSKKGIETKSFPINGKDHKVDWNAVHKWIADRNGKANLYFSVNALKQPMDKKAAITDIAWVRALHVDIDARVGESQEDARARAVAVLESYNPKPNVIIFSGGGAQGFWLLDEPISIDGDLEKAEEIKRYNIQLERDLGGDNCHNVDRIMRLPGTWNLPDAKKAAKGRVKKLAELLRLETDPYWPINRFKGAPIEAPEEPVADPLARREHDAKTVVNYDKANIDESKVHIGWLKDADTLSGRVEEHAIWSIKTEDLKELHEHHVFIGHKLATDDPYGSNSDRTLAIVGALDRAGYTPEEIAGICRDPKWPGASKHVIAQGPPSKQNRAVERALLKTRKDTAKNAKQAHKSRAVAKRIAEDGFVFPGGYNDKTARPVVSYENTRAAVINTKVRCHFDEFRNRYFVEADLEGNLAQICTGELTDNVVNQLCQRILEIYKFDPGEQNARRALINVCLENKRNPIKEYLNCLKWDGKPRIAMWMHEHLGVEVTPFNCEISRLSLMAAVKRCFDPGCKFDQIIVFDGPQGYNKSWAVEVLAGKEFFSDQHILDLSDKQVQENVEGVWLYEIADLTGISNADLEKVKAFASRRIDRARRAYGHMREDIPRSCIFFGTTNGSRYLRGDPEEQRRWWPVTVTKRCNLVKLREVRDQLWAEATFYIKRGDSIMLDEKFYGDATKAQTNRLDIDQEPWLEPIELYCNQQTVDAAGFQYVRIPMILMEVFTIDPARQDTRMYRRASKVLRFLGFKHEKGGPEHERFNQWKRLCRAPPMNDLLDEYIGSKK